MSSPEFVPWSSQSFDEWCKKYAPGGFVDLDGNRAHYVDKGKGDPLILLHGFGSDGNSWHANIDSLSTGIPGGLDPKGLWRLLLHGPY